MFILEVGRMGTHAKFVKSVLSAGLHSQSQFIARIESNHQQYMDALELTEANVRAFSDLHPDGSAFHVVDTIEGIVVELSVGFVPVSVVTVPHTELICELRIVARCRTEELNLAGKGRLKRYSCLASDIYKKLLHELRTGQPVEQSVDDVLRSRVISSKLPHHGSSLLIEV